ncbi:hypothetical protein ACWGMA_37225 [Streptomyces asiaticus]
MEDAAEALSSLSLASGSVASYRVTAYSPELFGGLPEPSPAWWVNFRVIDEGGWGSRGGVLSVLPLLDSGVFTEGKTKATRAALGV